MSQRLLIDGNNQLYNPIFCDLFPTNNGFNTCQNCNFDNLTLWEEKHKNNEQECLNDCDKDERCTSYSFNNSKDGINCSKYISFPSNINRNVPNINSGYSLKFGYDYNNLDNSRQENVKSKCANQYLNNVFTSDKNINLDKCLNIKDVQDNLFQGLKNTEFNVNPECLFHRYKENGINPVVLSEDSYYDSNLPPVKNKPPTYESEGCYKDTGDRAIPEYNGKVKTIEECANIARGKNKKLFGLQNFGECWTGNNLKKAKKYGPTTNCNPLGGILINNLYTLNTKKKIPEDIIDDSTFDFYKNPVKDPLIDSYEELYNKYMSIKSDNIKKQSSSNKYSQNDNNENNILSNKYNQYLINEENDINKLSNNIINDVSQNDVSIIESFESNNVNLIYFNNFKMILFVIIIIIIFIILFYTFKK